MVLSPTAASVPPHRQSPFPAAAAAGENEAYDEQTDGFQAQVQNFAKTVLGSCGNALSFLGWPGTHSDHNAGGGGAANHNNNRAAAKPPLSITDELRKLAAKEGRVFGGGMRRADIPRFLGEEAVYSFEDDNISAISQHTLEEMTRHGVRYPVRRKPSSESSQSTPPPPPPPPPTEQRSDDSQVSSAKHRKRRMGLERREGKSTAKDNDATPKI